VNDNFTIAVIGAGAAGYFAAIRCKSIFPDATVIILESSNKVLSKVKISGGGRCNVTHACFQTSKLIQYYPRGGKFLKVLFQQFGTEDTMSWFQKRGVQLKIESDNRVFPVSDNSQSIVDVLSTEATKLGVKLWTSCNVKQVKTCESGFELTIASGAQHQFNKLIVASGGHPKLESYQWLAQLGHLIIPPVPSLFTFNMPNENVKTLMGVVAPDSSVRIQGSKHISSGPLLITHWGMSGPAVLKLSAWAARELYETGYQFKIQVNWINQANEDIVRTQFAKMRQEHPKALLRNRVLFGLPSRLWEFLMNKVQIDTEKSIDSLTQKDVNRLINVILNDIYVVSGKTTFKEEFVTCGGVSLNSVSNQTLQSKVCPGLYFAGEILDIDGITGGFNFQAAWTTGYIAGALAID